MRTYTSEGIKNIMPNGFGMKNEFLMDPPKEDGKAPNIYSITTGEEGKDTEGVSVGPQTFIPDSNLGIADLLKEPAKHISDIQEKRRGMEKKYKYSSLAKSTEKLQNKQINKYVEENIMPGVRLQRMVHQLQQQGEDNKFAEGKDQNLLGIDPFVRLAPTVAGLTAGLGQLGYWAGNKIRYNNTYAENPYQQVALNGLNQLRQNPYPAIRAAYDAESRNTYNMQNAGGLTGAQRYYGMIGNAIANQRGIADIYANTEAQNNALRSQYYNSLLKEGNEIATRRQNAAQHDWSDYVAAHGRKTKGIETGIANLINSINGGFQNEFKYRMGNKTLGIYLQQLDIDRIKALADYEKNLRQPS